MKGISILNGFNINEYAFEKINEQKTALERAIERSLKFPSVEAVAILIEKDCCFEFPEKIQLIKVTDFSSKSVFAAMYETAKNYDFVFFADCDAPFLDASIAKNLLDTHTKYKAEYSFAEGFPKGLSPEILDTGLVKILAGVSNIENVKHNRNFIFESLKQNINSYDIETLIAPDNLQDLRLEFFTNNKRNFLLCAEFEEISCENYAKLINAKAKKLFTLPAYYAVEISSVRSVNKIYLPKKNSNNKKFLSFEEFKIICDKIKTFSDDAFISFSIFNEPFLNLEIIKMIDYALQQKNIFLLLETAGVDFGEKEILEIKSLIEKYNAYERIFWIINLDASSAEKYAEISNLNLSTAEKFYSKAVENILGLYKNFGKNVYPQFVRMNENEDELETFFRNWKEKIGCALIQKYDNLAGQIKDRRVADLSPITRNVCWHLKRDMYILVDGSVVMCKADIFEKNIFGNILTDSIAKIRNKIFSVYCEHLEKNYKGLCKNCDEYYTYNF